MVLLAALLNFLFLTGERTPMAPVLCSLGLLAFAAGSQVANSRQLSLPEIPTTQATAAYVDLFVDPRILAPLTVNRSRNRRVVFLLTLLAGSFVGSPAYRYVDSALPLFVAGMVKLAVTVLFIFNRGVGGLGESGKLVTRAADRRNATSSPPLMDEDNVENCRSAETMTESAVNDGDK